MTARRNRSSSYMRSQSLTPSTGSFLAESARLVYGGREVCKLWHTSFQAKEIFLQVDARDAALDVYAHPVAVSVLDFCSHVALPYVESLDVEHHLACGLQARGHLAVRFLRQLVVKPFQGLRASRWYATIEPRAAATAAIAPTGNSGTMTVPRAMPFLVRSGDCPSRVTPLTSTSTV